MRSHFRCVPRAPQGILLATLPLLACGIALHHGATSTRPDRSAPPPCAMGLAGHANPGRRHDLDLSLTEVTDADLACLRHLAGLRKLDLFATRVSDAGLAHLEGLTELRSLYLESTRVGDAGLAHLGRLPHLETLALSGTRVSDAGLTHLKGLASLQAMDLMATAVTDAGVEDLRRALPQAEINY